MDAARRATDSVTRDDVDERIHSLSSLIQRNRDVVGRSSDHWPRAIVPRGGRAGARRGADPEARHAWTQAHHAGGRLAGRRRIEPPPPIDLQALGASPGPFSVRSRRWPRSGSSRDVSQRGRPRASLVGSPISDRDNSRNSAACTQSGGAVSGKVRLHMGYPAPVGRRTLRRVARAAQHGGVADVERRRDPLAAALDRDLVGC